jgi:hypothetical protein
VLVLCIHQFVHDWVAAVLAGLRRLKADRQLLYGETFAAKGVDLDKASPRRPGLRSDVFFAVLDAIGPPTPEILRWQSVILLGDDDRCGPEAFGRRLDALGIHLAEQLFMRCCKSSGSSSTIDISAHSRCFLGQLRGQVDPPHLRRGPEGAELVVSEFPVGRRIELDSSDAAHPARSLGGVQLHAP